METVETLAIDLIAADPGQPRKHFDPKLISELAASIRANGLLQPITVRPDPDNAGRFLIIAGERRYRAHRHNKAETVRAIVMNPPNQADVRIKQIIENDQRADVSPLEQARSYQALMDEAGWSVEELGLKIGKAPHRITERTDLLKLAPEYQHLLGSGNLKPSEATELARLTPRSQAVLFAAIKSGKARDYNTLRAMANALVDAEQQMSLIPADDEKAGPSDDERKVANSFETTVERLSLMLRTGIKDNDIVAVKKVDPHKASHFADLFGAMQRDLRRIELALRQAAIQAELMA